jgi:predicted nucleic acid-binding protein
MEQKYLIDTNILIEYLGNTLPTESKDWVSKIIDHQFNISVIVGLEVLGHPKADSVVCDFINLANVIEINKDVYTKTIEIRKNHKIKLPDAIIAGTCLVYDFTIVTRNTSDFKNIKGLNYFDPYTLT